jgi:ribosomal protein S21
MVVAQVRDAEQLEGAIRRFQKQGAKAGIGIRLRETGRCAEPGVRRKKKELATKQRYLRPVARAGV